MLTILDLISTKSRLNLDYTTIYIHKKRPGLIALVLFCFLNIISYKFFNVTHFRFDMIKFF